MAGAAGYTNLRCLQDCTREHAIFRADLLRLAKALAQKESPLKEAVTTVLNRTC